MFNTVVVPVDPGEPKFSAPALEAASRFARDYGSRLRLVAVLAHSQGFVSSYLPPDFEEKAVADTRAMLDDLAHGLGLAKEQVSVSVRIGSIYHEVIEEAKEVGADLIVMESHRPDLSTYLLGSNAAKIVRHSTCSVMVLRPGT
ncbi:universal stress protein [Pannonibacter tanglangensis]|uniref:Universal stress protein n=1 Tax=Pannonibacter tanglangensis TaxID=2750084 RepID=A0ABW9ZKE5_9HYPH|nr:universal stress protein [Pannonibacter sp. XCT-34]NBN63512.1 universal stress protein [Pannonibacter sp. XCT-34]